MGLSARERVQGPMSGSEGMVLTAAFMSAASGLAHLSVAPAHFGEWWGFGVLFLIAAALQLTLALMLLARPTHARFTAVAVVSGGLIATWIGSRTIGLPLGPEPGQAEPVGFLDLVTTLVEGLLVVLAALAVAGRTRGLLVACEASGVALGLVLTLAFAGGVGHG